MKFKKLIKQSNNEQMEYDVDINSIINEIIIIDDLSWGLYAFNREPLKEKFSKIEKIKLINDSINCGIKYAKEYKNKLRKIGIYNILKELNINYTYVSIENTGHQVIFSQFIEPNTIEIFEKHILITKKIFNDNNIYFKDINNLEKILISHELFHVIEYLNKDTIFTKITKKKLWSLGKIYTHYSNIVCLSEIAAMSFTKELLNLDYNPYILDILMVYPYNKPYTIELYENIKYIKGEK